MPIQKKVTIKDVAKEAGVGVSTVSRWLNDSPKISDEAKAKVLSSIEKLGYVPDRMAQSLRSQKYKNVAFLVSDISNMAMPTIVRGLLSVFDSAGYSISLCNTGSEDIFDKVRKFLQGRKLDGIVLHVAREDDQALHRFLLKLNIPIVVMDRDIPGIPSGVYIDYYSSVKEAAAYLLSLGHRNIVLSCGFRPIRPTRVAIDAFHAAYLEKGLTPPEHLIVYGAVSHEFGKTMIERFLPEIRKGEVTAVISINNASFSGMLEAIYEAELEYPRDLSLITLGDSELTQWLRPSVTVIDRPLEEIGVQLGQSLINRIESNQPGESFEPVVIPTKLIVRNSCRSV
ncbi:LacI family DNA-binding transcriptional regulator [Paenibacillus cymbidii]|uniref:LacI family DNA-binding transcriptional regulator n=1 Tax=Paenibacillus cymbidii TaxID=1639034 RepID=UPI00108053A6|nr:LacI family DNA-binding transcriptional regulator [Paenibacillus cymbidii]